MAKYAALPSRPRAHTHVFFDEDGEQSLAAAEVILSDGFGEPADTGLCDARGHTIYRMPEGVGFDMKARRRG